MHHATALIFNDNSGLRRQNKEQYIYIKQELNVICNNIKVRKFNEICLVEDKNHRDCHKEKHQRQKQKIQKGDCVVPEQ